MDFEIIKHHAAAKRLLLGHCLQIAACCFTTYLLGCGLPSSLSQLGMVGVILVLAVLICGMLTVKLLAPVLSWHRRLGALAGKPIDPFVLSPSSGDTAADFGWNQLVEQGRHWQTLTSLRCSIDESLQSSRYSETDRLLDAVSSAIAAIDSEGNITYANAMMAGICGAESAAQLIGRPMSQAMGIPDTVADRLVDVSIQSSDAEWSISDGCNNRLLRGHRQIIDHRNESTCVWTIRDVTQQRLAESMREKFLTAATHEFRTPLANIRAYAESLDMGQDIDAQARKHFYNVIQSESQRLSQLVDDLLDISRMQAGALSLDRCEVDLGRMVEDAASKVKGPLTDKGLQLRCEFPPKFPKFLADKNMISAALVNLLGNAAKYTPEGGRVTFRVDINARDVQFLVSDTGIGIAPDELPRVFDRFFRSTDDRVQTISGSGLGLALVQEVARLHGGDVIVESVLDQGSLFRMVIPLE